jgi:glycosyltransferase involved in cell wall biosynthesis
LLFRRPRLTEREVERLYQYSFAGDWYFYALVVRGGAIAYSRDAKSFFRVNDSSASRSSFYTERHLIEHRMIIQDLCDQYVVSDIIIDKHAEKLAECFPDKSKAELRDLLAPVRPDVRLGHPIRVCIAAHSFAVGGGEVLPLELANELKERGCHVTYLVVERDKSSELELGSIRPRLRKDIPIVYWDDVKDRLEAFFSDYGIEVFNSHNVSVEHKLYHTKYSLNIPYVASLHGGYETVPELLTADFVAFLNKTVTAWLDLADKNRKILVNKGVSSAAFRRSFNAVPRFAGKWVDRRKFRRQHNIPMDAFVFVLCSRAVEEKNWQTAIEVVTAVADSSPRPLHLVLIGDGPSLRSMRATNPPSKYVTFLGHADVPQQYFRCFDMGIFPSTFSGETFPLFLLECFQASLPVIATDIGEIPRIMGEVATSRPGVTVDYKAGLPRIRQDMIDILQRLLQDQKGYKLLQRNARLTSKRFSIQLLAGLYESQFRSLSGSTPQDAAKLVTRPNDDSRGASWVEGGRIAARSSAGLAART